MSLTENLPSFSTAFCRILKLRGLEDPEQIEFFLQAGLSDLKDPFLMKGMHAAVDRIQKAIALREKILIHGDYDADGITATAILGRTFHILNAQFATFLPERSHDGYGVSETAIQNAPREGIKLLITVDCGITAHAEIELARQLGIDVIVIDHHRIPAAGIPQDAIILNPQQEDCHYPSLDLTAAGLVFKLSQALIGPQAFRFLDLVALSTVSDVAPLLGENRIFVKNGLKTLTESPSLGLKTLAEVAGIGGKTSNVGHLGFILGPRINASGRMSSPDIALRLLMTDYPNEAASLAKILDEENKLRQREERSILREAIAEVEKTFNFNRDRIIVIGREGWHQGVIGIVASRLVERFYRPALVVGFQGEAGKGSGRSVKGFNLYQALESCGNLLDEFGGHELAAGINIQKGKFQEFRKQINQYALKNCVPEIFVKETVADLEISFGDLNSVFVNELKYLEPYGVGNPRPVFLTRGVRIKTPPSQKSSQNFQFYVTDGTLSCEAHWANAYDQDSRRLTKDMMIDLFYTVKTRVWNGMESLLLEVKNVSPSKTAA